MSVAAGDTRRLASRVFVVLALTGGCSFDPTPDAGTITCQAAEECPPGLHCVTRIGRCIADGVDTSGPAVVSRNVSPQVVGRSGRVTGEFVTNKALFEDPSLSLLGALLTSRQPTERGETIGWAYDVTMDDTEGTKTVSASMLDVAGNSSLQDVGTVTFDFTAPQLLVPSLKIQPALARPGETVLVQMAFSELLQAPPMLVVNGGPPLSPQRIAGTLATFQLVIPANQVDGLLSVALRPIADVAGNVGTPGEIGSIRVDTTAPRVTTVEVSGGITVRSAMPGFNTFTIVAEADSGAGDGLRSIEVRFLGALLLCNPVTANRRECEVTVTTTMPEGEAAIQVLATDLAGNSAVGSGSIQLDFTAPQVTHGTFQQALAPAANALSASVTALGPGAAALIGFLMTEPVETLSLTVGAGVFACAHQDLTWTCRYSQVCSALADGRYPLSLAATDVVGNARTLDPSPGWTLEIDCTPPAPPAVTASGRVVWHRAPSGASWSVGKLGSRLELTADAVAETGTSVRVGVPVGNGSAYELARAVFTGSPLQIPVTDGVDRATVFVQTLDGAANVSSGVMVKDNVVTLAFSGPNASPGAAGLYAVDSRSDALVLNSANRWSQPTRVTAQLNARSITVPSARVGQRFAPLGNGRALMYGSNGSFLAMAPPAMTDPWNDAWVYDGNSKAWTHVTGVQPPARRGHQVAALPAGRALMFGGSSDVAALVDSWLFDSAPMTWRKVVGPQPPPRDDFPMAALSNGRVLLFGGAGQDQLFSDTWLFDPQTDLWTETPGAGPSARSQHVLAALPNGKALLYGGYTDQPGYQTWVFDSLIGAWTDLTGRSPAEPELVAAQIAPLPNGDLLLVGERGLRHEAWKFSATSQRWSEVDQGLPQGEYTQTLTATSSGLLLMVSPLADVTPVQTFRFGSSETWNELIAASAPLHRTMWESTALDDGTVLLFGGMDPERQELFPEGDTVIFDPAVPAWTTRASSQPWPVITPAAVSLSGGRALLVTDGPPTGGAWTYSGTSGLWSWDTAGGIVPTGEAVRLNSAEIVGTFGGNSGAWTYSTLDAGFAIYSSPPARFDGALAAVGGNRALVYGGFEPQGPLLTDTWLFDGANHTWQQLSANSPPDIRTQFPLLGLSSGDALLVGGSGAFGLMGDTWRFQFNPRTWVKLAIADFEPRRAHQLTELSGGRVLLTGGETSNGPEQASLLLDPGGSVGWTVLPGLQPPARKLHALARVAPNRVLLLGGESDRGVLSDAWLLDETALTWKALSGSLPAGRRSPRLTSLGSEGALLTGLATENAAYFDAWRFELKGASVSALAAAPLDSIGLLPSQLTSVDARVTAGADGYSLGGASLSGVNVELFRTSSTGAVFQSCASSSASAASPGALTCSGKPLVPSSWVAVRVHPRGYSNGENVSTTVESVELDVHYRGSP